MWESPLAHVRRKPGTSCLRSGTSVIMGIAQHDTLPPQCAPLFTHWLTSVTSTIKNFSRTAYGSFCVLIENLIVLYNKLSLYWSPRPPMGGSHLGTVRQPFCHPSHINWKGVMCDKLINEWILNARRMSGSSWFEVRYKKTSSTTAWCPHHWSSKVFFFFFCLVQGQEHRLFLFCISSLPDFSYFQRFCFYCQYE